jgi:hypothetical protein
MILRKAHRNQAKIKLAIQGPSGSGKTYSSLLIASGMTDWSKIAVIDTENHSADLYSHLGDYNVITLDRPFNPESYIAAIDFCEKAGMEVIIIDSLSHEWDGDGGILDIHSSMMGNSFTNWSKVTPRHNALVQKILQSDCHIFATLRTKQDYVLSDKNGKVVPEKVGLKSITRDGMDYEFTIVLDIDVKHHCIASKDRTNVFDNLPQFKPTKETGKAILDWCGLSNSLRDQIDQCDDLDSLKSLYEANPTERNAYRQRFIAKQQLLLANKFSKNGTSHH